MTTPSLSNLVNSEKDISISLIGSKVSVDCLKNFSKVDRSLYLTRNLLLDIKNIRSLGILTVLSLIGAHLDQGF